MQPEQLFNHLMQYPGDWEEKKLFWSVDKSELSHKQQEHYKKCYTFLQEHGSRAISLRDYHRGTGGELYKDDYHLLRVRLRDKRLSLERYIGYKDIRMDLMDFILMPDRRLILGMKHYLMSNFATFVYGAGRMIVSEAGEVEYIDNFSGHYRPTPHQFKSTMEILNQMLVINRVNVWSGTARKERNGGLPP